MAEVALAAPRADGVEQDVLTCGALGTVGLVRLARRFGLRVVDVRAGAPIPGSYWGAPEAGLIGDGLYLRPDTPVHSALHELSHFVCMSPLRRESLDTDAGGTVLEECGVCYLQLLLADALTGYDRARCLRDMDRWGYSFREGSAAAWFAGDGRDARDWLGRHRLTDGQSRVLWRLRGG